MPATPTIAYLTNSVTGHYQFSIWKEILPLARARGWNLLSLVGRHAVKRTEPSIAAQNAIYGLAASRRFDGVIAPGEVVFGAGDPAGMERFFASFGGKPAVLISSSLPGRPSILVDGRVGILDAVRHLAAVHGRKRIACLRGPSEGVETDERFNAYREALGSLGLPFDPEFVHPGDFTEDAGIRLAQAFARREVPRFDALVALNDRMAIGFQEEALRLGIGIPDDVSLTGFDDDEEAVVIPKPLSTVRQPFRQMAERALQAMEGLLSGRPGPGVVSLPARFIARESCGCSGELHGPADATPPSGARGGIVRLREALIAEASGLVDKPSFEPLLDAEMDPAKHDKRDLYDVSADLASTRRWIRGQLPPEAERKAERLLLEGQVSVARRIERAYARELISFLKSNLLTNELTGALAECISLQDIRSALGRYLPQFDYRFAAMVTVARKEGEAPTSLPASAVVELVLQDRDGHGPEVRSQPAERFPVSDVLPDWAMPSRSPWAATLIPLVDRGTLLGYLMLESRKEDYSIYTIFRTQVASTIGRAALLVELLERQTRERVEIEKMQALGTLVAGVAHEVNTPVGVGVTAASHLHATILELERMKKAGPLAPDELETFLADGKEASALILANLQRAASLILSFKRVAADSSNEERRRFDVRECIDDIIASLSPRLKRTKIAVEVDCPEGIVVDGYPGPFSQTIANFTLNSIQHAFDPGAAGRIAIRAREEGGRLRLVYEDDGRGIPEEHLGRIFEPFFTTSRESGGTGLGLHIVYNAVTGGKVSASNRPVGGAMFTVEIPMSIEGARHG